MLRSLEVLTLTLAYATLATGLACASAQTSGSEPRRASVAEIATSADRFVGTPIVVAGKLVAQGNYFSRDRRVFLQSSTGEQVEVQPWLPLSVPPAQNEKAAQPATLADFLGKNVELRATVRSTPDSMRPRRDPYYLEVTSAKILGPGL